MNDVSFYGPWAILLSSLLQAGWRPPLFPRPLLVQAKVQCERGPALRFLCQFWV